MAQIDYYVDLIKQCHDDCGGGLVSAMESDLRQFLAFQRNLVEAEDRCFRLAETDYPQIVCPWCLGSGTNGHDRCYPPNDYICQMCGGSGVVEIRPKDGIMDKPIGTSGPFTEHPIIFNGEMVRAILDGSKTQTRRMLNPQPKYSLFSDPLWGKAKNDVWCDGHGWQKKCPYGVPGDRLWAREKFSHREYPYDKIEDMLPMVHYWADGNPNSGNWSPPKASIHMPRWASRVDLEITDIRVERLQDISENDAKAEGASPDPKQWDSCYTDAFIRLWDSINEKRGSGWETNPWVWVIEFRRL